MGMADVLLFYIVNLENAGDFYRVGMAFAMLRFCPLFFFQKNKTSDITPFSKNFELYLKSFSIMIIVKA